MQIENLATSHGATVSVLHPLVAVAMILAIVALLVLPRKYALVAFLSVALLAPFGQQLYVGGVHIFVARILILAGWMRMAWTKISSKDDVVPGGLTAIDKVFFFWAIFHALAAILLSRGDMGAIVYQSGFLWDAVGGFFLIRFLIQDEESVVSAIKTFAVVVGVVAVTMLNEKLRDQNVFGYLGSIPILPDVREGSIRARGPFAHAILAGVFAATLLPLFFWMWQSKKSRLVAVAGVIGCTMMVLASASSTPILSYLAVILGCCFWPLRKKMRVLRWGSVILLIVLNVVMKAPVWFLIGHVDLVPGNSSYHRAMLIDTCIRHFGEWWLIGTDQTVNWGIDMWDLSNQFVAEAEGGGLLTFICFILVISWGFGWIGKTRKLVEGDRNKEWFLWFLGVALFSHVVSFFGTSYFDQTKFMYYALLSMICVTTSTILAVKQPAEEVNDGGLVNSRFVAASPSPSQRTSDVFPYKHARPFKPRSSYAGKLDK